jgi:gliding motility-associated-like protein
MGNPDTYPFPGDENTNYRATDGNTFLALEVDNLALGGNNHATQVDAVGQKLPVPMTPGTTYLMTMDLARIAFTGNDSMNFKLEIAGTVSSNGGPAGVIWTSPYLISRWKTYTIQFTAPAAYDSILLVPVIELDKQEGASNMLLIDHITGLFFSMQLSVNHTNACNGTNDGTATVTGLDPNLSYTYLWKPGNYTTKSISGLKPGDYQVTVDDNMGRRFMSDVTIGNSMLSMGTDLKGVSCYGLSDGILQSVANGGVPPYDYQFNGNDNGDNGLITNAHGGDYHITVKDSMGCGLWQDVSMPAPDPLQIAQVKVKAVSCSTVTDGRITVTPAGGTPPYMYNVSGNLSQADSVISGLDEGSYNYTVTDSHDCETGGSVTINKNEGPCGVYVPTAFSPNGDGKNDVFRIKVLDAITDFAMVIADRYGNIIYQSRDPEQGWDGSGAVIGSYAWVIRYTDGKGQAIQQTGSVTVVK